MLLHFDGFNATADYNLEPGKWAAGAVGATTTATPRSGQRHLVGSGPPRLVTDIFSPAPSGDARCGIAQFVPTASAYSTGNILEIREGSIIHLAVNINASGNLVVKRGSTTLETGTSVVGKNAYFYVELGGEIGAAGSYEVRLNGALEMSDTGVNTQNGGTGAWDNAACAYGGHDNGARMDDWYLCDTSGSKNNDFLGAIRVVTGIAVADSIAAGSNADFTPNSGTDHGSRVDELTPNGDTDYNTGINNGDYDTYRLSSISAGGQDVLGIRVCCYVKKTDVAARTMKNAIVSGGSGNVDLSEQSPTTTYGYKCDVVEDDPDIADDWTETTVNAMEAGLRIHS